MKHQEVTDNKIPPGAHRTKIDEMMEAYICIKEKSPGTAYEIIKEASECGNIYAQLELSKFLRMTPTLPIEQSIRYQEAERILQGLFNTLDMGCQFYIELSLELAILYSEHLHRPAGALGMYLYAKRLGGNIDEHQLEYLNKKMMKSDINHLGENYHDALLLGKELQYVGSAPRLTEFFLREAVDGAYAAFAQHEKGAKLAYAQAALALGDYYDSRLEESMSFRMERDKLYAIAKAYGYPEYISKAK